MDSALLIQITTELLQALGASVDTIDVSHTNSNGNGVNKTSRTTIKVTSPDTELLVGTNGENLQALNTILHRLVEHTSPTAGNFLLDINGYHEAQMEPVRDQARILAQRARLFKRDETLPPMTAYQRLVVHELFAEDPDLETYSQGEGVSRHIVLKYKK